MLFFQIPSYNLPSQSAIQKLSISTISVKESYLKLDDWDLKLFFVLNETDDIENDPRVGHMSVAFTFLSEELLPGSRGGQGTTNYCGC